MMDIRIWSVSTMIPGSWVPGHRVGEGHEDRSGSDNSLPEKDVLSKREADWNKERGFKAQLQCRTKDGKNGEPFCHMALDICFNRLS